MEALPDPERSTLQPDAVLQIVPQRSEVAGEYWDVPVELAHAAFDRALSGSADDPARTG